MPPLLHLSDIIRKYFPYRRSNDKQKGAVNKWTNEGLKVSVSDVERYWIIG